MKKNNLILKSLIAVICVFINMPVFAATTTTKIKNLNFSDSADPLSIGGSHEGAIAEGLQISTPSTSANNAGLSISSKGSPYWFIYQDDATDDLRFWNVENRVTIIDEGNVGIGTTSPAAKLHVYNPTSVGAIFQVGTGDGSSDASIDFGYNGYGWKWLYKGSLSGDNNELQLWSEGAGGADQQAYGIKQSGIITFNKNAYFLNNVGIGTTTPKNKLDVEGSAVIGATYSGTNTAPTNGLLVEGNVGIGITSPSYKLEVDGDAHITGDLQVDGNFNLDLSSGSSNTFVVGSETIDSNISEGLQILTNTGNAGLAIKSATSPHWSIYQDDTTDDLRFWNGDNRVTITDTGNVGIGTDSPGGIFSIKDNLNFIEDNYTTYKYTLSSSRLAGYLEPACYCSNDDWDINCPDTFLMHGSNDGGVCYDHFSEFDEVTYEMYEYSNEFTIEDPISYSVLDFNKSVINTKEEIIILQNNSPIFLSSPELKSLRIGVAEGKKYVGYNETAVGFQSLYSNTSGMDNSAFGKETLYSNTIGGRNSAFGSGTLYSNTSGMDNSAFGSGALYKHESGLRNSAFGSGALYSTINGIDNSAFGAHALVDSTTGRGNTSIGESSMRNNTSGSYNSALGNYSLDSNITGSKNVGLGYSAGRDILGLMFANQTGSNSVFLGANTKALADGQTNQIVIGYDAVGKGSNTVAIGNSAVTLNYFYGAVSADSFTDRTPYPKDLQTAYDAVFSMERLPDLEYDENDKEMQLDHSKLSDYIKIVENDGTIARDMSATISAQNEVIKDLVKRVEELERIINE